jgi:hypothetical protein
MMLTSMMRSFFSLALLLIATAASASHITVSVTKTPVGSANGPQLLYVAFADEPLAVDVSVVIYSLPGRSSSALGIRELQSLDAGAWWKGLIWTLTNNTTGRSRTIPPGTLDVIRASSNTVAINHTSQHRGTFRLDKLTAGDYNLEISLAGVTGRDSFAVRNGTESPFIRDKYLERQAGRATDYAEFKKIQLQRLELLPKRADILLALAKRALDGGTLQETNDYYDLAIRLMEANKTNYARTSSPASAAEMQQRLTKVVTNIRALQAELPRYFARRAELAVVEEMVQGEMRFVLKERRSGKVVRVIHD